jgi:hypothetical protein
VIKKHGLKTLSEDQFLELIATRVVGGKGGAGYDEKTKKKMAKEEEAIRKGAKELEKRESSSKVPDMSTQLWTTRYAPQTLKEICGNKGQVEKLQNWLNSWLVHPHFLLNYSRSAMPYTQVVKPQIQLQKTRKRRYERFPCRDDYRSTWNRQNHECAPLCEVGGVHAH